MNFLQLWSSDFNNINKCRMKCINSVLKQVKKKDKYILLCNGVPNFINIKNYEYYSIDNYLDEILNKYDFIRIFWNCLNDFQKNIVRHDIIRFVYLFENPNTLYLDTDIFLLKKLHLDSFSLAALGWKEKHKDYSIIYNANDLNISMDILKNAINNSYISYKKRYVVNKIWILKYIQNINCYVISYKYFKHKQRESK